MKKRHLFFALCATLAFASCEKEQSELNLDQLSGKATVSGTVYYDPGVNPETNMPDSYVPKANAQVMLSINYSQYNQAAVGKQQYIATTDAEGKYSFEIPVSTRAINATVEVLPFFDKWTQPDGIGSTLDNCLFESQQIITVALENNKIFAGKDFFAARATTLPMNTFNKNRKVTINGDINLNSEEWTIDITSKISRWDYYYSSNYSRKYQPKAFAGIDIEIVVENVNHSSAPKYTYNTKTVVGATNSYTFDVPIPDNWELSDTKVTVMNFICNVTSSSDTEKCYPDLYTIKKENGTDEYNDPIYVYEARTQYLTGVWSTNTISAYLSRFDESMGKTMPTITLNFTPNVSYYSAGDTNDEGYEVNYAQDLQYWH